MANVEFHLDHQGIAEILKSPEMRDAMNAAAVQVAARARAGLPDEAPVEFRAYTTDRRAATVTVQDRRALQWEEEQGVLTRAAREAGLEVTEHPTPE